MQIAHISDLHLCSRHLPQRIAATEMLIKRCHDYKVDHLFITGDIAHDARPGDWQILRTLLARYGFLSARRTSLVIGNHDIYGGVHLATDILHFPNRCRETNYDKVVRTFGVRFRETFDHTRQADHNPYFPYVKLIGGKMIIGLNSIARYSKFKNSVASNGYIAKEDFRFVKNILSDGVFKDHSKVVLLHHHLHGKTYTTKKENRLLKLVEHQTMRLYQRKRWLNLFSRYGVSIVCHGHVHTNRVYDYNGVRYVGGGGTMKDERDYRMKINFIDSERKAVDVQTFGFSPDFNPQYGFVRKISYKNEWVGQWAN